MIEFDIIQDGVFHTYTVDMTCNDNRLGFIGGIRLDSARYDSACTFNDIDSNESIIKIFHFIFNDNGTNNQTTQVFILTNEVTESFVINNNRT